MYQIIDSKTGAVVGTYSETQARRARARADKLDSVYGAVRYTVRFVQVAA